MMIGHCLFPTDTLLGPKGVYFTSSVLGSLVYSMNGTRERGHWYIVRMEQERERGHWYIVRMEQEREEKQAKSRILGKDLVPLGSKIPKLPWFTMPFILSNFFSAPRPRETPNSSTN